MRHVPSAGRFLFTTSNYLLLAVLAATMVVPFLNVTAVSFTTDLESYESAVKLWPREPSLAGYRTLFKHVSILRPFLNNAFVTVIGTLMHVVLTAMAGFALAKDRFLGKGLLVVLVTLPMMIPFQMIIIPVFVTVRALGLLDSLWAIIVINAVSTFSILLMRNYFGSIPRSLEESAVIDGASELTIFFRIYVPLAAAGLATVTIFQFVALWNHFLEAILFLNTPLKFTLQIALRSLVISQETTSSTEQVANNTRMAGIVVSVIPLVAVYVGAQRYFIKGVMLGAVKG